MAEPARITPINDQTASDQTKKPADTGHYKLPGESALWFNRYLLYRNLGHKRTLKAAVVKERENLRLLKEPEASPEKPKKALKNKKEGVQVSSSPAPAIQVPGSWKVASKTYQWAERARSFDAWLLRRMAESTYEHLGETLANKYKRIQLLDTLIKATVDQLNNASSNGTTHKNYLAYIKEIAALLEQIKRENCDQEDMMAAITAYGKAMQEDIEKAYHDGKTVIVKKV